MVLVEVNESLKKRTESARNEMRAKLCVEEHSPALTGCLAPSLSVAVASV